MNDPIQDIDDTSAVIHQLIDEHLPATVPALDLQVLKLGVRLSLTHLVKRAIRFAQAVPGDKRGEPVDKIEALREELELTSKLLDARNAVLSLIPECEDHGAKCLPNAQAWIENALARSAAGECELTEHDVNISAFEGGISVFHNDSGLRIDIRSGRGVHAKKAIALRMVQHYLKTEHVQ
jgi:hypothetical protein